MKKKFTAPFVTSMEVATQQMIAASKPNTPIVKPEELPYEYNSADWLDGDYHWEGFTGTYLDIYVNSDGTHILHKDLLDTSGGFGDFIGSLGGYAGFNISHEYVGCFIYNGENNYPLNGIYKGQKYHLYTAKDGSGYYFIPCN